MIASDLFKMLTQKKFRLVGTKVFTVQRHRMSGKKGRGPEESDVVTYLYHGSYCKLLLKINTVQA